MRLRPIGEHAPQERSPGPNHTPTGSSVGTPTAPTLGTINLESMLSVQEEVQAGQTQRVDLVPTTGEGDAGRTALSVSFTKRAMRSLVDWEALRRGHKSRTRSSRRSTPTGSTRR